MDDDDSQIQHIEVSESIASVSHSPTMHTYTHEAIKADIQTAEVEGQTIEIDVQAFQDIQAEPADSNNQHDADPPVHHINLIMPAGQNNENDHRREIRDRKPLIWMKDFVSLNIQDILHAVSKYMSYDSFFI
ncbi:hypothetical protein K7X08_032433 [Anisodus acutangulus]|uniref:Uncharacterized protein n=1 Tax=Anisodus acutangulus TaxID=402998 RepID=A0A9Q1N0J5_9SOLA|nr:hypothetical protein K7X08_032433 [Anisodus acutangulus]